jgi:tetratricopeptide (TPR) repeat protein
VYQLHTNSVLLQVNKFLGSVMKLFLVMILSLLFAGCASTRVSSDGPEDGVQESEKKVVLPFTSDVERVAELNEDILFHYILADLAAQQGQLTLAYNHYLHVALLAADSNAARYATQIALFQKNYPAALKSSERWVKVAPNSIEARIANAILLLREGKRSLAMEHFHAAIKISQATGKDGFLVIALSLSKEKKLTDSLEIMKTLANDYAADEKAWYANAVLLSAHKSYEQTLVSIDRALALKPGWVEAKMLKVRVMIEKGNSDQAIDYLEEVVPQHEDNTDLHLIYAKLLVSRDHALAYREFERLHRKDRSNTEFISALAVLAVQLNELDDARDWWGKFARAGDGDQKSEAEYQLGQLEELNDNLKAAAAHYQNVSRGKYKIDAGLRYARVQAELGNLHKAREQLRAMRLSEPENVIDYYLVEAEILAERLSKEEVFEFYASALEVHPGNTELMYSRGVFSANIDLVDNAERDLRAVLAKEPEHADALNALGYTLADQTTRYDEALKYISKAYELKPGSAAIVDSLGWVYYRLGKLPEARKYLQQALNMHNDDEIAAHLGEVLWVLGEKLLAQRVWSKALEDFPDSRKLPEAIKRLKQNKQ